MSVFVGGCGLVSAQAVCGTDVDVLGSLIDKSLLRRDGDRYLMLETIREYACERLEKTPAARPLRRRHAEYFLALVELTPPKEDSLGSAAWFDRLGPDAANIRAAVGWAIETADARLALALVDAAYPFWVRRGYWMEGTQMTRAVLALPSAASATLERGDALIALGHMALSLGAFLEARKATEDAVAIFRSVVDAGRLAGSLSLLAGIDYERGDHASAAAVIEEALTLAQDDFRLDELWGNLGSNVAFGGDLDRGRTLLEASLQRRRGTPEGVAPLHMLGVIEQMRGNYELSAVLIREAISSVDLKVDVSVISKVQISLALTDACRGDLAGAAALCAQGLHGALQLGDQVRIGRGLDTMAIICSGLGQDERAARLFGAAEAFNTRIGAAVWVPIRRHLEPARGLVRDRLGSTLFERARDSGRQASLRDAVSDASHASAQPAGPRRQFSS